MTFEPPVQSLKRPDRAQRDFVSELQGNVNIRHGVVYLQAVYMAAAYSIINKTQ